MAEENLIVEHMPDATTAYFDVQSRRLVLPCWDNMSESIYDMLVAHEVGHALFTPGGTSLDDACSQIDKDNKAVAMQYLNVTEDARIEKLMKRRYRGLALDFRNAYSQIWDTDMFGLKSRGIDPNNATLIDRLNIKAKCGVHTDIRIDLNIEDEMLFSEMMTTETFEQAVAVAKRIYEVAKERKRNEQSKQSKTVTTPPNQQEDSLANDNPSRGGESVEADASEDGNGNNSDRQEKGEQGDASGQPANSSTNGNGETAPESITTGSLERTIQSMRDQHAAETFYFEFPAPESFDLSKVIVPPQEIANDLAKVQSDNKEWQAFVASIEPQVRMLAKEFELRKAADASARAKISKTGKLNVSKLHRYRFSEDLFLRNTTVKEGKSHGMVMLVDWSSSMDNVLLPTIKQTIMLAMFCRAVNIPFSVYSFSERSNTSQKCNNPKDIVIQALSFFNWLNSDMKKNEFLRMASLFFSVGDYHVRGCYNRYNTSGTPLQQSIVTLRYLLPEFRRRTGVQILNSIILTDGDDSFGLQTKAGNHVNHYQRTVIRDRASGLQVEWNCSVNRTENRTGKLLDMVKHITGCNTVGFHLIQSGGGGRSCLARYSNVNSNDPAFDAVVAQFRDNKFYAGTSEGYNAFYLIPSDKLQTELEAKDDYVHKNLTKGRIAGAFTKTMATRQVNRVLLRRFIAEITRQGE
jgi:uncharacterized protein YlaN (UPF0358 family)